MRSGTSLRPVLARSETCRLPPSIIIIVEPVARILRKVAMADMVKPTQKFSSAHGTAEVDEDMLRSYTQSTFELQQSEYNKVKLKHTCEAEKHMHDGLQVAHGSVQAMPGVWLTCAGCGCIFFELTVCAHIMDVC